jgi:hypothetical protein
MSCPFRHPSFEFPNKYENTKKKNAYDRCDKAKEIKTEAKKDYTRSDH